MKVLSLFDGMSCGQIALKELGIIPEVYYASEIDKNAIAMTMYNFQNARIRRLTPTECARLQTIPNWYKFRQVNKKGEDVPMSDSAIYKALGNGWTAEAIKHMFQFLPDEWKTAEPASGDYMGEY